MVKTIDELSAKITSIVRPNRFRAKIVIPAFLDGGETTELTDVYITTTNAPSYDVGVVEVPTFGGSTLKLPGDEILGDWTATIIYDKDSKIYRAISAWQEFIKSPATGLRANDSSFMSTISLEQLDGANGVIQTWQLLLAFPISVGELSMSKEEKDSYSQFDVTFAYSLRATDLTS